MKKVFKRTLMASVILAMNSINAEELNLPPTPVTANPLGVSSDEFVIPVSVLSGRELEINRSTNIADTLVNVPGVSMSHWGPSVGRPIIRGMDGDRVRILQNGINILDVSSFSADHAVPLDPLVVEQIDVIRGPATLIYGGGAVGGVVNAIDHRILREPVNGITGRAETRFGGNNSERSSAFVLDVGNEKFGIHIDAYTKETGNLNIAGYSASKRLRRSDSEVSRTSYGKKGELRNSGQSTEGASIGTTFFVDKGYIGVSHSMHDSTFGNPVKSNGRFELNTNRWDVHSELHDLNGFFNHFKFKMAHTDYRHDEIHGGEVEAEFRNRGLEGTVELGHHAVAGVSGVIGAQIENSNFKQPIGEAFMPNAGTRSQSLYIYEELPIDEHKITFGARYGDHDVKRNAFTGDGGCDVGYTELVDCGGSGGTEDEQEFSATEKSFKTKNAAIGGNYKVNDQWSITANLGHNERAPRYFELFPYGSHHATETVQKGNENLNTEQSNTFDFQFKWKNNVSAFSVGPYYTRFTRFIGMFNTGTELHHLHEGETDSEAMAVHQFRSVGAVFRGMEFNGHYQINDQYKFHYRGDYVKAEQRNGKDLPRVSPLRIGMGVDYSFNRFYGRLDLLRAFNQNNIEDNELATDGYYNLTAYGAYKFPTQYNISAFVKGYNLLDDEIRDHASFMKDKFMMGGRSVLFGLSGNF